MAEGEQESGFCCFASDNPSEEASSLMVSNPGSGEVQEPTPSTSRHATVRKRCLVEIFAVLCLENDEALGIDQILQENLVLLSKTSHKASPDYVLCNTPSDKHLQINLQGYLILTGPNRAIEVEKYFSVGPFYDVNTNVTFPTIVWDTIRDNPFENFMCNSLESRNGFMVVKFAVYRDGLEALLELTIADLELRGMPGLKMPLEIYGTVRTSNSVVPHSQVKSYLFDVGSDSCDVLDFAPSSKVEVPLPLSRRVTVIPRESTLIVDVSFSLRCSSGDISIANESVSFHASTRSNSTVEEHIIKGQQATVKVKVTWIEAFQYDINEGEEREGVIEDRDAVDEECDREDDEGAESEDISDDV